MATSSSLLSCYTLLIIFFFLLLIEKNSLVSARGFPGEYHLTGVESLLSSKSCSMPDKGMGLSTLMLVEECGPCSPLACEDDLSPKEIIHLILRKDQARVDYINSLHTTKSTGLNPLGGSLSTTVPAEEGAFFGS